MDSSAAPISAASSLEAGSAAPIRNPQSEIRNKSSGPSIHILSEAVTSRIAAGEVVERPASVIKELVENALDAGATSVSVEISGGGKKLIRVSDNGRGMLRADLALCCLPHATSKIARAEDLAELQTLGFRGEALPSIASVSHFSLTSCPRMSAAGDTNGEGWRIDIDGGDPERPQPRPAAAAPGSSAEVRDLFYNLPARAKFLKGDAAEASACADTLLRLALTRPDVSFSLRQERHEIFSLPACCPSAPLGEVPGSAAPRLPLTAFQRRAREVLGRHNSQGLVDLAVEGPGDQAASGDSGLSDSFCGYRLYGLISPPAVTRANRSQIYLTVNGRAVKDRVLTSALLESYRHLLPPKRYPAAVLFLDVPAPDVDINVHPTKAEVRFRLGGLVYALFHHAIRSACGITASSESNVQSPESVGGRRTADGNATQSSGFRAQPAVKVPLGAPRVEPGQKTFDLWSGARPTGNFGLRISDSELAGKPPSIKNSSGPQSLLDSSRAAEAPRPYAVPASIPNMPRRGSSSAPAEANPQSEIRNPQSESPQSDAAPFRILGQAGGSYVILEDDSGVKLIDQHALHERILFEDLLARAEGRARGDSQGLLIPEPLELSAPQAALLAQDDSALQVLRDIGFEIQCFGPRSIAVSAVPAILRTGAASLVRDVLDALGAAAEEPASAKTPGRASLREKAAYVLSCKGAIKAGERLTTEQMSALIIEFRKKVGRGGFTCPHGRPLAIELSWEDLERGVGRR